MDSLATWPTPLTSDDRGFDAAAVRQLAHPASSRTPAEPRDTDGEAASAAPSASRAGAGKTTVRERLLTSLLLVIPVVCALVVVGSAVQYTATHQGLWLGLIAVVLVLAALAWVAVLRRSFARAQGHLAARLPGVVGHGVGVVRELEVDSPFDENGVSDTVTAHLTVRVNPTRGPAFTGALDAVYRTSDLDKLTVGSHGPVRYLRSDPEGSVGVETRLDPDAVQRIYRAAAMN